MTSLAKTLLQYSIRNHAVLEVKYLISSVKFKIIENPGKLIWHILREWRRSRWWGGEEWGLRTGAELIIRNNKGEIIISSNHSQEAFLEKKKKELELEHFGFWLKGGRGSYRSHSHPIALSMALAPGPCSRSAG
jgi:hypothetical protein